MSKNIFVATEYWNNGESWGDNAHSEEPIKVFNSLNDADRYYLDKGFTPAKPWKYNNYIKEYEVHEEIETIDCPIGKDWQECDKEYEEDFCDECWDNNWINNNDYSFKTIRIYEVKSVE